MPRWTTTTRVVAGVLAGLVAIFGVTSVTLLRRGAGPAERVTSLVGGVSVAAPSHWSVEIRNPTDPRHPEYIKGHQGGVLGFVARRGFWVSRWSVPQGTTLASLKATMRASNTNRQRHDIATFDGELAGRPAAVLTYKESPKGLRRLRLNDTVYVVRQIVVGHFTYQLGTWHAERSDATELDRLVASFQLRTPAAWTKRIGATTLRLPGGWVEVPTTLRSAKFFAVSPGDPADAWVHLFHDRRSPAAMKQIARASIAANGGGVTGEQDNRLDFTFPDKGRPPAHDVEWFVDDGRGGTWVLAVGRRGGDPSVADALYAGLQVPRQ